MSAQRCPSPTEGRKKRASICPYNKCRGDHCGRGYPQGHIHVAVALDGLGRRLGALSVSTTPAGYKELVDWANGFGPLGRAGVEGTGSFGAGLTRFLRTEGIEVFEVIRPPTP